MVAIGTMTGSGVDWFWNGTNIQGKWRLGVLEKRRERMERGLNISQEEIEGGCLEYFIKRRGI